MFYGIFRPGIYQAPRSTLRHFPLLPAAVTTAALGAAAFFMPSMGSIAIVRAAHSSTVVRGTSRAQMESLLPAALHQGRVKVVAAAPPDPALSQKTMQQARARLVSMNISAVMPLSVTVRRGDTLSSLAKHYYGSAKLWPALWWVNRKKVPNPAALLVGTNLTLSDYRPQGHWVTVKALAAIPKPKPAPVSHVSVASSSGGGGGGGSAPAPAAPAYTGGVLTAAQVGAYWLGAGGPAWAEGAAEAVAYCESGYNPAAYNPSGATGLFQILGQVVPGNLTDPAVNAANAVAKFTASGDTWAQWVCQP